MAGQAYHERSQAILFRRQPSNFRHRTVECVAIQPGRAHNTHRPRQSARGIADGNANAALPYVQSSYASHSV